MITSNPFSLVRASDFTNEQINSFWVDLGFPVDTIIEPKSGVSKFILGGKGTGKTHILRYYSYPVIRLRTPKETGISILKKHKFLAIFLRATGIDAVRFESSSDINANWQHLFGIYLELRLTEGVLDACCDIKSTSGEIDFNDMLFLNEVKQDLSDDELLNCQSIIDFKQWIVSQRKYIDKIINNAAFTGSLDLHNIPFSIGMLSLSIGKAIHKWHPELSDIPILYLIDEIENFSERQQQVVNTLVRYGEHYASFRITGRRYGIKTLATLKDGEENREGAEFKTEYLDDILHSNNKKFRDFAKNFVIKRLESANITLKPNNITLNSFDPALCFEEVSRKSFYSETIQKLRISSEKINFIDKFLKEIKKLPEVNSNKDITDDIVNLLIKDFPLIIQKLNILLFFKKYKKNIHAAKLAKIIKRDAEKYINNIEVEKYYTTAYDHYSADLFAQICNEAKVNIGVIYAGFDNHIKMASCNPRNLLIILGKVYDLANFREVDFISGNKLSLELQTDATVNAAKFLYESDTNFGRESDIALSAVSRLASILRVARFSMNIPEVSPLAFSFNADDLSPLARKNLQNALNYSLIFEIIKGRPDRNSQKINKKIQLNPLLSPKWSLPITRRGDINLNKELLLAVFDDNYNEDFDSLLNQLDKKWNSLISDDQQRELF